MLHNITPDDFGKIISMLQEFRLECPEYNYVSDDPGYVLTNLTAMYDAGVLFGVVDNDYSGFMLGALSRSWYSDRLDAAEQVLFILPHLRGTMLAVRMIREFERMARELGAHTLGVGVSTGIYEDRTRQLYARLGFIPKGHSLSKELQYV